MRIRDYRIRSGVTIELFSTIKDLDGNLLGASDLDSLTLTLIDELTHGVINNRSAQDILNVNGGVLDEAGNLSLRLDPDDMGITNTGLPREWHDAQLTWLWTLGSPAVQYTGFASLKFRVLNVAYLPSPLITGVSSALVSAGWRFWRPCGC